MFSMTMRIFLEVELLVPIEILFLTSWGTAKSFSTVAPTIYISTAMQKTSNGFSSLATFWAFWDKVSCSTSWPWTSTLASRVEGLRHKLPYLALTNSYNCQVFLPVGHRWASSISLQSGWACSLVTAEVFIDTFLARLCIFPAKNASSSFLPIINRMLLYAEF